MRDIKHYTLSSKRLKGRISLHYVDGRLYAMHLDCKMEPAQWAAFCAVLPLAPDMEPLTRLGFAVEQAEKLSAQAKVRLFCTAYYAWTEANGAGVHYKATQQEGVNIGSVPVDELLLRVYFASTEWWASTKTIPGYIKHINRIRELAAGHKPLAQVQAEAKAAFPDHWDRNYFNGLAAEAQTKYIDHLRSLGLKPVKDAKGNTQWLKEA